MDGAYVINLDEYESVGTHWIALYVKASHNVTYFNSFRVSYSKEIKNSYLAKILEQVVKTSLICDKYRKFKNPKIYVLEKYFFFLFVLSVAMKMKRHLKKKKQWRH